jgi:hypothetical protein
MCSRFRMQEKDILEHVQECQVSSVYNLVNLSTMVSHRHTPHTTIEHTHAKILIGALGRRVSQSAVVSDEFVDY